RRRRASFSACRNAATVATRPNSAINCWPSMELSSVSTAGSDRSLWSVVMREFSRAQENFDHDENQREEKSNRPAQHARYLKPGAGDDEQANPNALPHNHAAGRQLALNRREAHVEITHEWQHRSGDGDMQQHKEYPAWPNPRQRCRHQIVKA